MEKKYVIEVQLTPQVHEGNMAYYWHIDLVEPEGRYAVRDGFARTTLDAFADASVEWTLAKGI